jgi:hypothetical protein
LRANAVSSVEAFLRYRDSKGATQVVAITGKSYRVKEAPVVTQENKKNRKSNENPLTEKTEMI